MKLIISATIGDNAIVFRRKVGWLFGSSFILVLGIGFLFDVAHLRGDTTLFGPWPYLTSFAIFLVIAASVEGSLALIYSSHRLRREAAILRKAKELGTTLFSVYLRQDVRRFLSGDGEDVSFGTFEESVTLEFNRLGIRVWRGASRPRLFQEISWADISPLVAENLDIKVVAVRLSRAAEPFLAADALIAWGVLGIRRRGVAELLSVAESFRPVEFDLAE